MQEHGPLRIEVFVDPMFAENGLLVAAGDACWIIDPGFAPQPESILDAIEEHRLTPAAILLTHCHVDHIAGVGTIRTAYPKLKLIAPRDETHMLTDPMGNLSGHYGFPIVAPEADVAIGPNDPLELGGVPFAALDVSGHSPGGLAYHCAAAAIVIGGDALFAGSVGRYDFPGSSGAKLISNIRRNLLTLPPETVLYPGHGPSTTIAREARTNPYLKPSFQP